MRRLIVLILMMFPMLSDASSFSGPEGLRRAMKPASKEAPLDGFIYKGSGRLDSIDYSNMVITIAKARYPMNPYSFEATYEGVNLPTYLLRPGLWVKFFSTKGNEVSRVEVFSDRMKEIVENR